MPDYIMTFAILGGLTIDMILTARCSKDRKGKRDGK